MRNVSRMITSATIAVLVCSIFSYFLHSSTKALAATQATYYVAPNGSDNNPGTIDSPFQTLDHARSVVSGLVNSMSGDIVVNLRGGTYNLNQPLQFGAGDSGANGYNVIYQAYGNEIPVISGGQTITGWSQHDSGKNIWQASVSSSLQTRQLYVNGTRAVRARSTTGLPGTITQTATGYTTTDTSLQIWSNPGDIEFVYTGGGANNQGNWVEQRCGVSSISGNASSTTITMKQPCYDNAYTRKQANNQNITNPTYIENNYTLLDQPGEWYLDHAASTLYYIPRSGEDMSSATVVAPTLETLVSGNGVHNVQFTGITFAYATWLRPSGNDGFAEIQANYCYTGTAGGGELPEGNVSFQAASSLRFERNTFIHLGNAGLRLWNGSQNNTVIGNVFTDISASGIEIGDVANPNATGSAQDSGNTVTDNYIHDLPVEYHGGVGIFAGYVAHNTISHNEIANTPYSGISEGWGWGAPPSFANSNVIQNNLIYNIMQLLLDGGGIYVLGQTNQPGSTISGNYIHNQGHEYGALYPDEGSSYWDINNNVVASVPRWLHIWTSSIHDINVHDNFSDTATMTNNGTNITLSNNYTAGPPWPTAAQNIINNAGIESAYQDIKGGGSQTNLALNKTAYSSSVYSTPYDTSKANDGDTGTGWSPTGTDTNPWWEVDLGQAYTLSQIQLVTRQELDQPETRQNFEIWASNNADMSLGHVVLGSQGNSPLPYQATLTVNVTDTTAYRYVAAVKTRSEYFFISELRVFGH